MTVGWYTVRNIIRKPPKFPLFCVTKGRPWYFRSQLPLLFTVSPSYQVTSRSYILLFRSRWTSSFLSEVPHTLLSTQNFLLIYKRSVYSLFFIFFPSLFLYTFTYLFILVHYPLDVNQVKTTWYSLPLSFYTQFVRPVSNTSYDFTVLVSKPMMEDLMPTGKLLKLVPSLL